MYSETASRIALFLRCCLAIYRSRIIVALSVSLEFISETRERIRQIESKALRKLRHPSRSKKLRDYLD